jgi:hypothetical protein
MQSLLFYPRVPRVQALLSGAINPSLQGGSDAHSHAQGVLANRQHT